MRDCLAAGLLALALPAYAAVLAITWTEQGRFETEITVQPGQFAEVCGALSRDHPVDWGFDATAPTQFNIHYHAGNDVVYPSRQDNATQARGVLKVDVATDYCWMWSNPAAAPVRITLSLKRA